MRKFLLCLIAAFALIGCGKKPEAIIESQFEPVVRFEPEEKDYIANRTVRIGIETTYPPFIYKDDSGKIVGLSKDVLDRVLEISGLKVEFVEIGDLKDVLEAIRTDKVQLITSVKRTDERSVFLSFSNPYVVVGTVMLIHSSGVKFPLRVGFSEGYAVQEQLQAFDSQVQLVPFPNDTESFSAFVNRDIDACVLDEGSAALLQNKIGQKFAHSRVNFTYDLSFAVQKNDSILESILNKSLESLSVEERNAIARKWLIRR